MTDDVIELRAEDYFKDGEQVYIHIDGADGKSVGKYTGVMHRHNFIEIVYVISGSARHCLGDMIYEVRRGDLVIVNYGVQHTFIPLSDTGESFSTYDLLFTTELFEIAGISNYDFSSLASSYLFCSVFPESIESTSLNLIRSRSKEFHEVFSRIYDEYTKREVGFMSMIRAYLIELITLIFREINRKTLKGMTSEQKELITKATDYLKHNYNTRINLDDMVADVFLSKDYFRQLFKKTTGLSITDFVQQARIDEARRLLSETNRTVYDIAGSCGFTDVKFFYKTFKKMTGMLPSEYRKEKHL